MLRTTSIQDGGSRPHATPSSGAMTVRAAPEPREFHPPPHGPTERNPIKQPHHWPFGKSMCSSGGPQTHWHQGPVSWKTIFPRTGRGRGWLQDDSSTFIVHSISIIITSAPPRIIGIRSQRFGTPALEHELKTSPFLD